MVGILVFHTFISKYHMTFEMSTVAFHDWIKSQILKFFDSKNISGYSFVTLIGMFLCVSALYFGILRITMDFTAGLSWSVTKVVEQSMLHNGWEKWHHFMLCLDLSLRKKGQIISLVFTWIEQVAHVLDHYLCKNIWIPWWPVLIV